MAGLSRIAREIVIGHYSHGLITGKITPKQIASAAHGPETDFALFRTALLAAILLAGLAFPAASQERPLIWEFTKDSDTNYLAKVGSRLPTRQRTSLGADVRVRGPDPERFGNPVSVWISAHLAGREQPGNNRALDLNARMEGAHGNVSVRNHVFRHWALMEAEVNQEVSIEFRPAEERRRYVRQSQELILKTPATKTELHLRTARADAEAWRTTISLTQKLRDTIELTATLEEPGRENARSRFGARYHYQW